MNGKTRPKTNLMLLLLTCLILAAPTHAPAENRTVAVILSQKIKPYMQVLKGIQQGLDREKAFFMEVFSISPADKQRDDLRKKLLEKTHDLFLAIGPEAGELIWSMDELRHKGKLFSAILNPQNVDHMESFRCGVSLQIPVSTQLSEISTSLPDIKKIGLLFDPKYNLPFFEKTQASENHHGIKIIPLSISSKPEISRILKENLNNIDCVWMIPDPTVITEKIVQYVIKQALYQKKGVIGYNTYFIKSGAVFAFELDYYQIGIQTADKARAYFNGEGCRATAPSFQKIVNAKMARHLGMTMGGKQE